MNPLPRLDRIGPLERLFSRPSWADPTFMTLSSDVTYTTITIDGNNGQVAANANPRRWAIGFILPDAIIAAIRISPTNNPLDWGEGIGGGLAGSWFTIFQFGPIVCREWYCVGTAPDMFTVIEVEIQEGIQDVPARL